MTKIFLYIPFTIACLLVLPILISSENFQSQAQEGKAKRKRPTPIAAVISAPKGETAEPVGSEVISSVEDASKIKEVAETDTQTEILSSPKGKLETKTEVLTAPKEDLPPVPLPTVAPEKDEQKASSPIIRSAEEVAQQKEAKEKEVIRSVKDVYDE